MLPIPCRLIRVSVAATPPACTLAIKFVFPSALFIISLWIQRNCTTQLFNLPVDGAPGLCVPFVENRWSCTTLHSSLPFLRPPHCFVCFSETEKEWKPSIYILITFPRIVFRARVFQGVFVGGSCKLSRALFAIAIPLRNVLNLMPWFDHTARRRNNCRARSSTPGNRLDCSTNRKLSSLSCSLMKGLPSRRVITFSAIFPGKAPLWLRSRDWSSTKVQLKHFPPRRHVSNLFSVWIHTLSSSYRPGRVSITTRKNFRCLWPHFHRHKNWKREQSVAKFQRLHIMRL